MRLQPTDGSNPIPNGTNGTIFVLIKAYGCQVPWDASDLADEPMVRRVPETSLKQSERL